MSREHTSNQPTSSPMQPTPAQQTDNTPQATPPLNPLTAQLGDKRVPIQQRQKIAAQIGQRAGNRFLQRAIAHIQRDTAQEIITRYTDWGGLNLQEDRLGEYLYGRARAGDYNTVTSVIRALSSSDRDDVAEEIMKRFTLQEVITMGQNAQAVAMLRLLKEEMLDFWSMWITDEERRLGNIIRAVLNEPGARDSWNRETIERIKAAAGNDLEALAQLFESDEIIDDGTLQGRTQAVLSVTAHLVIPGLQTGIEFGDTGFAGDQNPGGAGFRDPHPSSRNQVGHFLTAVGLEFAPGLVSRRIPALALVRAAFNAPQGNTVREMIGAPASMTDEDVALRLTIGHEKAPDPNGTAAALSIALRGVGESFAEGPEGETEEQRDERIGRAMQDETTRQIREVIAAFRRQFEACTEEDVAAWNRAIAALGTGDQLNLGAAEAELRRISINFAYRGNSIQDLRLSLVGWRLGQMLKSGEFGNDRRRVAAWLRTNLGAAR